jgi:hypothetical protein
MKPENASLALLVSFLLAACVFQPVPANGSGPEFSVSSSKPGDTVTITSEENVTIMEVNSPGGIGSARFELVSGAWPQKMIARLHLKGLEEFRLLYADTIIAASASSGSSFNTGDQRVILSGAEEPVPPGHPLWMDIRIVSDQTSPGIPLEEGYFEITFPREFIAKAVSSFEIQWVDFFRQ